MNRLFKKALVALIVFLASTGIAIAGSVMMKWTPNSETDLAGYNVYRTQVQGVYQYGTGSPNFVGQIPCTAGDGTCAVFADVDVGDGQWFWVVTAYDTESLESAPSNEVTYTFVPGYIGVPPASPKGLGIIDVSN